MWVCSGHNRGADSCPNAVSVDANELIEVIEQYFANILKSKKNQISYILEFKYTNDSSVDLKQLAKSAIDQINSRRYDSELSGTVIRIELAHYQKNVEIEWQ